VIGQLHSGQDGYDEFAVLDTPQGDAIRVSDGLQRISISVAILILFTSSFDIFLVVNAGGNFRFCQMILPPLIALAIIKASRGRRIPTLGLVWLGIWFLFQLAFIPTTDFWPKSLGYCFWLLLNLGMVFAFVQLFADRTATLRTLLRWYLYSFAFVSIFGILQFVLPIFGLPGILVTQWWILDVLPRVNGFSYEPSYFACYLLIGFVLAGSLRRAQSTLLSSRSLLFIYWLTVIAIVLSSSRIGIAFLLIDSLLTQLRPWRQFLADLRRRRIARSRVLALIPSVLSLALISVLSVGGAMIAENNPVLFFMFLNGTGVSDLPAHSIVQRENSLEETLEVFVQHPLIGRSLGGVSSAIAENEGEVIHSFEDSKNFEGMSVFAEVLAGSGVIGFLPFIAFLITTIRKPLMLAPIAPPFYSSLLRGLVRSLVFAWAVLQFNQNVLRPYLWTHVAILATVYAATLRVSKNEVASPTYSI
jgi:O-antigen ligase/polysaccharide polymerase Wzy-like membrane protein